MLDIIRNRKRPVIKKYIQINMLFKSNEVIFSETIASRLVPVNMMLFIEFVFSIGDSVANRLKTFSKGIKMESSRSPIRKILLRR